MRLRVDGWFEVTVEGDPGDALEPTCFMEKYYLHSEIR